MADKRTQHKELPFSGKLMTAEPAEVGANFQTLKNLRYTDGHLKGISGMAKINGTAIPTYPRVKSAFHFNKVDPAESHLLVQAYTTAETTAVILQNTATIPGTAAFSSTALWSDASGFGLGRFADAADQQMIYCNGVESCIWGGNEINCGAFLTSTAAVTDSGTATNPKDYTDIINNSKQDGANVAVIGGGIDSCTVLVLHGDGVDASTTITDSSSGGKAMTANGDAQIDASQAKFGTGSILFDGTGDYVSTPDHADFNFGTGTLTIEGWVRFNSLTGQHCLYSQASTTTYVTLYYDNTAHILVFSVMSAGTRVIHESGSWTPSTSTWYHVAVVRGWGGDADDWAITVDGTAIATFTNAGTLPDSGADLWIGLHPTTVLIDDGATGHGITAGGNAAISAAQYKFANGSLALDGNDWVQAEDHADFTLGSGDFCIEAFVRFTALPGAGSNMTLFAKGYLPANRYGWQVYVSNVGGTYYLGFGYSTNGAEATRVLTPREVTISTDTWYHFAVMRDGTNLTLWMDGAQLGAAADLTGVTIYDSSDVLCVGAYYGVSGVNGCMDEVRISNTARTVTVPAAPYTSDANTTLLLHCNYMGLNGWLDEYRVSKALARWTANFTPWARPYSSSALYWLVGSPRPLQGLKYYVSNGNMTASTMTGKEWNGNTWNALTLTDNTDTGASLAATGTVTFSSTVNTAKPKYLEGYFLYWYQFALSAGEAEVYRVTLDAPFQEIVDMWDGVFRSIVRFYKYTTAFLDNSVNVLEDDYDAGTASTYCDLSSMGAFSTPNNCLGIGFTEKMAGIKFDMAPDYLNSTAGTTMSIDYWNGTAYTSVGAITDGTAEGGISLAKTGVVSWNNNSLPDETKMSVANAPPLYYYRVRFDKAMDAAVRVNCVTGITAQNDISHYKFPVFAQGRTLLCGDMSGERHKVRVSSKFMPQVYNGSDSVDVFFGDGGELTGGIELFSLFGNSLYSLVFMFKDTETWVVAGTDINSWEDSTYLLSNTIGCPAPLTIKTVNLASEPGAGINRMLVIWQGANGVYMSDGRAPIPIHGDIKEYFDRQDSRCIRASKVGDSVGFIDPTRQEYHLLLASGSGATTLNTELVYDIHRNKWFEIERSADLQCGVLVHDTDGNDYDYGFINTGYCERLEYGTTSDGSDITHTVQFGDMALAGLGRETQVDHVRLIEVAKTTTTNSATLTHYGDGNATGTAKTLSPARSGYRLAQPYFDEHLTADPFHSFKIAMTTNDETIGFEPLALVVSYHATHQD
jgi:hypothetical protein